MKTFEYAGRHYTPLPDKLHGDFSEITRRCRSVGIGLYSWSTTKYDYDAFYNAAATVGGSEADLFLCTEDDRVYIPCYNELFLYANKNGTAYTPCKAI